MLDPTVAVTGPGQRSMRDCAHDNEGQNGTSKRELHLVIQAGWISFPGGAFEVSHDEIAV
jgi:hypothetical protein